MSQVKAQVASETAGRQARLEELYERNAPSALRTAYFLTGDSDLAEDLVQEAFVRVAGRFGHLRTPDAFPAYLRRTIVNLFTLTFRRRALEREWLRRQASERVTFQGDPETRDDLWRALASCRRASAPRSCCATTRTCPNARPRRSSAARRVRSTNS